jgi:hypothetical protein
MDSQRGKLADRWAGGITFASAGATEGKEQRYSGRDPDQTDCGEQHSPLSRAPLRFGH